MHASSSLPPPTSRQLHMQRRPYTTIAQINCYYLDTFYQFFHQNVQEILGVLKHKWPKKNGEKKIWSQAHQSCKKLPGGSSWAAGGKGA